MLFLVSVITLTFKAKAQNTERIQASYLPAFGRLPSSGEITYWNGQAQRTVQQLVDNHKDYIKSNQASFGRELIIKSYIDTLGYRPSQAEVNYHAAFNRSYTEMMSSHLLDVKGQPTEYEKVIKRSYQTILGRQPSTDEINYWKSQGHLSYTILVNCHQEWKNKNTVSKTTSITLNAPLLATASVSSSVLSETKAVYSSLVSPGGGNIVAGGAGN